jgi:uncharacterized protein involved in exopolysaccharide biosynthesis
VFLQKKQSIDFREISRMLWRRRWVILLPFVVTVAAALVGSLFMEPQYESTATLAFENPVPLTRTVQQATGVRETDNEEIRVMRKRMLASSFLESVAVQVGLTENPRIHQRVDQLARENPGHDRNDLLMRACVGTLTHMLDIRAEGSDIFYVRAVSNSPELSYRVASTVAELYVHTDRQSKLRQSEEAFKFAQEQAAIYEGKLEEKRRQLREYEQQAAVRPLSSSPVSPTTVTRVRALISDAEADQEFARTQRDAARSKVNEAGLSAYLNLDLLASPTLKALRETLYELELHLAMTMVEARDDDPAVTSAKNQIAAKNQQVLRELENLAAVAFPTLDADSRQLLVDHQYSALSFEAADRRKAALQEFVNKYASDLASVPAEEFRTSRLKEEVESANRVYQTWQEQAASTHIAKAVQSSKVGDLLVVLEPPKMPLVPFAPEKKNIFVLAAFMGIGLGIGTAVLIEYLDMSLKSVEDIEEVLALPILGTVPRMQAAVIEDIELRRRNRIRILVPATLLTVLALAIATWFLLTQNATVG